MTMEPHMNANTWGLGGFRFIIAFIKHLQLLNTCNCNNCNLYTLFLATTLAKSSWFVVTIHC
jgi:hypothetical protein